MAESEERQRILDDCCITFRKRKVLLVKIGNENYICEVVLKQSKNETRFYLHEVTEQKKFRERAFLTNLAQKPAHPGTLNKVLENTVFVNTTITCPLTLYHLPKTEGPISKINKK